MDNVGALPRFQWAPPSVSNAAGELCDLMDQIGKPMDFWQRVALETMLGETPTGQWSAIQFGLIAARQNGKGGILEARELGGLFLFGENLIIHSAHEFATAAEAFRRMKDLIDGTAWLSRRVKKVMNSHGSEGIELMSGQRLSYRTRTAGGGRGFTADVLVLDEAQKLDAAEVAALMPTLSASPNPQMIYTGTVTAEAAVLRSVVERGRKGGEQRFGYAEWSAPDDADPADPAAHAQANPALGIRISAEYVAAEQAAMPAAEFAMERLSIWPEVSALGSVIAVESWARCDELGAQMPEGVRVAVGVAVSPKRDWASVGVAGLRPDGATYVELIKHEPGTDWLLPYLVGLADRLGPVAVVVDQGGPAGTLLAAFGAAGLPVRVTDTGDYINACAGFVDHVKYGRIRHRGQTPLTDAAVGVKQRTVGERWVYARRDSSALVAPLEAVTLAVFGLTPDPKKKGFFMQNLNDFTND